MQREMKEKKMTNAPAQGLYKTTDVDHKALGDQSAYGKAFFSLANVLIEVRNSVDVSFNAPTCTLLTCGWDCFLIYNSAVLRSEVLGSDLAAIELVMCRERTGKFLKSGSIGSLAPDIFMITFSVHIPVSPVLFLQGTFVAQYSQRCFECRI